MKVIGLARIGRDPELRETGGDPVMNLALAFSYGKKADGEKYRPTQWVDAALWGKRAEALEPYLEAGGLVSVILRDVHIETYEGRNGTGTKLVGTVLEIDLAGSPSQGGDRQQSSEPRRQERSTAPARAPARNSTSRPAAGKSGGGATGFDDMDDDIPF